MPCVTVRGCRIGEGRPKVILPIVEQDRTDILARGRAFAGLEADCVEFRADWFSGWRDADALARCLTGLRQAVGEKLLLVTLRTRPEGGQADAAPEEYDAFCRRVCAGGCADLLDIEFLPAGERLPGLIAAAHARGVAVVCSSHDFSGTPSCREMVDRLCAMQRAGADLPKLAVMPQSRRDLLALLAATAEMAEQHPATPVITMSMGALGGISRLCGEAMGSAMTFACAGKASAPGQIELDVLNPVLDRLRLESLP